MKRTFLAVAAVCVLSPILAFAAVLVAGRGRSSSTARVTMPALTNYKNCIKSADMTVDAQSVFRILDGGTTIYAVTISSGGSIVRDWEDEFAPCSAANNTLMEVYVSAGNFHINLSTFSR